MNSEEIFRHLKRFLITRFSLYKDKEDENEIVETIRRGVEFRGVNVWILIFAVLLASLGLNVNSTAVIIGAMLISPLMGPIMGIGLGLGIFDFELLKVSAKNLAIMVIVSLIASTLYFLVSPLSHAQSELLARTSPTIWDVLIALFGGLAGIVAGSSKEKGTVIPGVAIATALMPPLCTAGYGIAQGDLHFLIGAFYYFCINAVFISIATLIVVRILKFKKVTLPDKNRERKIRNVISVVVIITIIPSIAIAYLTVQRELFEQRVMDYVRREIRFDKTFVLNQNSDYNTSRVNIFLAGSALSPDTISYLEARKNRYGLEDAEINFIQVNQVTPQHDALPEDELIRDVYASTQRAMDEKDSTIAELTRKVEGLTNNYPVRNIADELVAINSNVSSFSMHNEVVYDLNRKKFDTIPSAYIVFTRKPNRTQSEQIRKWLQIRTQTDTLRVLMVEE